MQNKELTFKLNTRNIVFVFHAFLVLAMLTLFIFSVRGAFAQSEAEANKEAAIKELSAVTGQTIGGVEDAKKVCSLEANITACAEIGQKYNLYQADRAKEVESVLEEIKGSVVNELKSCQDEECFAGVAEKLAKQMVTRKPEIASKFDLTASKIKGKRAIVSRAKELGVNFEECRTLDPDTAAVETLRACARLAKDDTIKQYIPEEARAEADQVESTVKLKESLSSGKYQCGGNTPESCGNFCLNPSAEARAQGAGVIPEVCRLIAKEFFGAEGEKELEKSYGQVGQVRDFYKKRADNVVFETSDGVRITNPAEIGRYIESQGKQGNIGAVEKGMDFMVANGFIKNEDKEFALKMMKQISSQGTPVDFDQCKSNPESCEQFIPEELKGEFQAKREAEKVFREAMVKEGVSDPRLCNDPAYAEKCISAQRNALPSLESVQSKFGGQASFVEGLRKQVQFSEQGLQARKKIEEQLKQGGGQVSIGDRSFSNFEDMNRFCSENGSTCLTEATKQGFVDSSFAIQKFEESFAAGEHFSPPPFAFGGEGGPPGFQFPGGGQTGGQFPGQGFGPGGAPPFGGQFPGSNQGGASSGFGGGFPSDFNKEEALKQFKSWAENPNSGQAPNLPFFGGDRGGQFPGQGQSNQGGQGASQFPGRGPDGSGQFPGQNPPFDTTQGRQGGFPGRPSSPEEYEKIRQQFQGKNQGEQGRQPVSPEEYEKLKQQTRPLSGEELDKFKQQFQETGTQENQHPRQPVDSQQNQGREGVQNQFPGGQFPGGEFQKDFQPKTGEQYPRPFDATQGKPVEGQYPKPFDSTQGRPGEGQVDSSRQQQQQQPVSGQYQEGYQKPSDGQPYPTNQQQTQPTSGQNPQPTSGDYKQPEGGTHQQPSSGSYTPPPSGSTYDSGQYQQPSGGGSYTPPPGGGGSFNQQPPTSGSVFGIFQRFFSNIAKIFGR